DGVVVLPLGKFKPAADAQQGCQRAERLQFRELEVRMFQGEGRSVPATVFATRGERGIVKHSLVTGEKFARFLAGNLLERDTGSEPPVELFLRDRRLMLADEMRCSGPQRSRVSWGLIKQARQEPIFQRGDGSLGHSQGQFGRGQGLRREIRLPLLR